MRRLLSLIGIVAALVITTAAGAQTIGLGVQNPPTSADVTNALGFTPARLTSNTFTGTQTSTIGTITASTPALDATQTWNNAGVIFKGLSLNVTNTTSAGGSRLLDLLNGGASQFSVDPNGFVVVKNGSGFADATAAASMRWSLYYINSGLALNSGAVNSWSSASGNLTTIDTGLSRVAAGVVGVGTGAQGSTAGEIRVAAAKINQLLTLGSASFDFGTVDNQTTYANVNSTRVAGWTASLFGLGPSITFNSSFPCLKRSSTAVLFRLCDDSADAPISAAYYTSPAATVETAATHTVTATESALIANRAGTVTVTLPTASSFSGRWWCVRTIQAQTVVSNASNVVPMIGGSAGTAILAATAGKWACLQSDATSWQIMTGN